MSTNDSSSHSSSPRKKARVDSPPIIVAGRMSSTISDEDPNSKTLMEVDDEGRASQKEEEYQKVKAFLNEHNIEVSPDEFLELRENKSLIEEDTTRLQVCFLIGALRCRKEVAKQAWSLLFSGIHGEDELIAFLKEHYMEGRKDEFLELRENDFFIKQDINGQVIFLIGRFGFTEEVAKQARSLLVKDNRGEDNSTSGRGPNIVDGLETELVHNFDFEAFCKRIEDLFKWHDDRVLRMKYSAPYFAFVQSSGMGKTRLFAEYRKSQPKKCLTILCVDAELSYQERKEYFDHLLFFDEAVGSHNVDEHVWEQLEKMLLKHDNCKELVLLFDEAQGLMNGTDVHRKGSLMFRAVRWWLREERRINVVAAFAGTNAKLSNIYPQDPPMERVSRVAQKQYKNYRSNDPNNDKKTLYPPFFELHTTGCFVGKVEQLRSDNEEPGFPHASVYGRPLFAYYYRKGFLDDAKLKEFASRLVLSREKYESHLPSCYSVLGARVQMGIVNSFETLSTLVSSGYACLVEFQPPRNFGSAPVARSTFMPDPLCATLAMRYMDENWSGLGFEGKCGKFWVEQAAKAFNSRLCLPEKEDASEIFAALYMLLCGDVLRRENDSNGDCFAVSMDDWFRLLKTGGVPDAESKKAASTDAVLPDAESMDEVSKDEVSTKNLTATITIGAGKKGEEAMDTESKSTISFVQVCRNDFRGNSFCDQNILKHMYVSGVANYAYKNCEAIDIVSAIKVVRDAQTSYHPLLISVKNWATVTNGDVAGWKASLMAFLNEIRRGKEELSAVCLLILVGCPELQNLEGDNFNSSNLGSFPLDDVYRLVSVPESDQFGVSEAIAKLGAVSETTEIYSSHGFLAREKTADSLLRKQSPNQDKITNLFDALKVSEGGDEKLSANP